MCFFMFFFFVPTGGDGYSCEAPNGGPAKRNGGGLPTVDASSEVVSGVVQGCGRGARGCCSQWGEDEGGVPCCGQLSGVWGLGPGEEDVSVCCRERRGCWCGCRPGWSVFPVGRRFPARLRHRGRGRGLWVQRGRSLLVLPRSPALVRRLPRHIQSFLHRVRQASLVNLPLGWLGAGGLVIAAHVVLADGLVISW